MLSLDEGFLMQESMRIELFFVIVVGKSLKKRRSGVSECAMPKAV